MFHPQKAEQEEAEPSYTELNSNYNIPEMPSRQSCKAPSPPPPQLLRLTCLFGLIHAFVPNPPESSVRTLRVVYKIFTRHVTFGYMLKWLGYWGSECPVKQPTVPQADKLAVVKVGLNRNDKQTTRTAHPATQLLLSTLTTICPL